MRPKHLVTLLVLLTLTVASAPTPAHAGGIVSICDQAHLLAALVGGSTVTFSCSGTITLTGTITIVTDTTIDGSGQTVTISGNHAVRVFTVNSGVTLNLSELTVANGRFNGGWDDGGGGISNSGTLTISNSTLFKNGAQVGGGIYNSGTLTVSNSTFAENYSKTSGGIDNGGTLIVSNSTFVGNGGWDVGGIGNSGIATVSHSTFSGNRATFGDSGGILNSGTLTLKNTIVANSLANTLDSGNCAGEITDGGGNLSYPDATCPGINGDPMLGPLANWGGPTETMGLRAGSAALAAANDATCAASPVNNLDQRGTTRPVGPHCDIGAYEGTLANTFLPIILR